MKFAILIIFAVLAGCASSPSHHELGMQAIEAGDLKTAEAQLNAAIASGDSDAWNELGVVYARTGRNAQAISAYQMGARHGSPTAQQNLVRRGLAVPQADLKAKSDSGTDGLASMLNSYNAGRYGNSPPNPLLFMPSRSITCDSQRIGNTVTTDCR